MTRLPPESRTTMTTFQLFFFASASAPTMTFFACSSVMGGPYGGGGGGGAAAGCCALARDAPRTSTVPTTRDTRRSVLMGPPPRGSNLRSTSPAGPTSSSDGRVTRERRRGFPPSLAPAVSRDIQRPGTLVKTALAFPGDVFYNPIVEHRDRALRALNGRPVPALIRSTCPRTRRRTHGGIHEPDA